MPFGFLHSLPPKNSNYDRDHKDSAEQAQVDSHRVWAQPCCSVSCWPHTGWIKAIPRQADLQAVGLSLKQVPGTADAITAAANVLLSLDAGLV